MTCFHTKLATQKSQFQKSCFCPVSKPGQDLKTMAYHVSLFNLLTYDIFGFRCILLLLKDTELNTERIELTLNRNRTKDVPVAFALASQKPLLIEQGTYIHT